MYFYFIGGPENPLFLPANVIGVLFAITSAAVWGGGDFSGGLATRRSGQFQVLVVSALSGLVALLVCAAAWGESFPALATLVWPALAGAAGAVGIASLYRGLSMGHAASVAPTSGVIAAALPVAFSIFTLGPPPPLRLVGFALAFAGIWLVTRPATDETTVSRQGFLLACVAGIAFGAFFILIAQSEPGKVFTPLIIARGAAFFAGLLMLRVARQPFPSFTSNPIALLAGVLDAGGNIFFLLARQFTRLDIAAVLASLYPAATVILATIIHKEKASRSQWAGAALCLLAIILITV
jgi:drug/metabolite transporter (DMT)-like permease